MKFGIRKLESWATKWRRNYDASFLRFNTIPACDGRTDTKYKQHYKCECQSPVWNKL